MARFIAAGYKGKDLVTLNRVRKHQQVLFLSDILGVSGGSWDKQYLQKRRIGDHWLLMKFPREEIMESEMGFWHRATAQVVSRGPAQSSLGRLKTGWQKCGNGKSRRAKAASTVNATTVLLCTGIFGGDNTSASELVNLEG
jgi:hypothetical protein